MFGINFSLGTDNSALETGLEQAKHKVENFKEQAGAMLMTAFAGVGIEQIIAKFSKIKEQAEMFQTTTDAIQRVGGACDEWGTSIDTVERAFAKLRSGIGTANDGLAKLGINAKEFSHAQMDEQILMITRALETVSDPQERINKAFSALGPRMRELMPMLNAGTEKIREQMNATATLGEESVEQIHSAEVAMKHFQNTISVLFGKLTGIAQTAMTFIGTLWGDQVTRAVMGFNRIGEALKALGRGDFKGVATAYQATLDDMKGQTKNTVDSLKAQWDGLWKAKEEKKDEALLKGEAKGEEGEEGKESKKLSFEEKVKQLQEDHARKQLDSAQQLQAIEKENTELMKERAALGIEDSNRKEQIETRLLENLRAKNQIEDQAKKEKEQDAEREANEIEKAKKKAEQDAQQKQKKLIEESFRDQEKDIGRLANAKVGEDGQHLAGVNYGAIDAAREKQSEIQTQMRDFLEKIADKEFKVEIPDAK